MKFGILGGTFDPPHLGHLAIARAAIEALGLDEVVFMPAHRNPLKKGKRTPAKDRLEMTRLLIDGEPNLAVSDLEIGRGGPSYAIETVMELQVVMPGEYWFLLGVDALSDLPEWRQPERLVRLCRLGVVNRGYRPIEDTFAKLPEEWRASIDVVPMTQVEVSSSEIRNAAAKKQSLARFTKPAVAAFIESHKLYA